MTVAQGLLWTALLFAIPGAVGAIWGGLWMSDINSELSRSRPVTSGAQLMARYLFFTGIGLVTFAFLAVLAAIWMTVAGL